MNKIYLSLLSCLLCLHSLQAQDDLLSLLQEEIQTDFATASFKTNRVVNGHSLENTASGVLDFKISHRFAPLQNGFYDIFGLDGATIRIGLDYGITDRLMVGVGRSSKEKIYDGFLKYKILRQQTGRRSIPISVSYLTDLQVKTIRFADPDRQNLFWSRFYYTHQLLIGRKFTDGFTLQFMPTLVHRNLTQSRGDRNDVFALGLAGRLKLTPRVAVNAEYYYVLPNQIAQDYRNSLSVGLDIETGGHVFQLHFTNSQDMTYKGFITETREDWFYRDANDKWLSGLRFGFNISRVFTIVKPKNLF